MLRFIFLLFFNSISFAGTLTLGTTSTTVNSGLMDYLLPYYTQHTGHDVKIITGGTGFILQQLKRGDIKVAITHQPELEKALLDKFPEGKRQPFMRNYFILVGPTTDPANVAKATSFSQAFAQIYDHKSKFISRGDKSGSHIFELKIWDEIDVAHVKRQRPWYLESGQDMGPTLNMASAFGAYMLADQGTWSAYANRSHLRSLYVGLKDGENVYSVLQLQNSSNLPPEAVEFIDWLLRNSTLNLINNFKINSMNGFSSTL